MSIKCTNKFNLFNRPIEYERVYLAIYKVAYLPLYKDTPFLIQGNAMLTSHAAVCGCSQVTVN